MFYKNFLTAIEQLDESEQAEACFALCKYGITGELPENPIFKMFCVGVSASIQKYDGRGGKRYGAGRKPNDFKRLCDNQKNQNNQKNQKNQNNQNAQTETETETETETKAKTESESEEKELSIESSKKKGVFKKPTVEDVSAYCKERGNSVDPESFYDFYQSKGWRIGKEPMKDWKAAVRTWEKRNGGNGVKKPSVMDQVAEVWDF